MPASKRVLGALFGLALLLACGGEPPTGPTPPDPVPTPQPTPSPPAWPPVAFPVRTNGTSLVDSSGRAIWRWGAWDLYGSGWTVPTLRTLSQPGVLQRLADAGVNWVGARPGPQRPGGPDGYPCDAVLPAVDATIASASSLGMVTELALFDLWVIQHGFSCDQTWDYADFQGDRLTGSQLAWLESLAQHSQSPAITLLDGNEMFKASPSVAWFRDLKRHVRRLWPGRLLATNAESRLIEREADYVIIHQDAAVGVQSGRPTGVNESGPALSCLDWAKESQYARRLGTFFDLWRGDMDDEQWAACLADHASIRKASGH